MGFKWDVIASYEEPEVGLYRLIGEMLRGKATLDDLDQIREFLSRGGATSEAWQSIGEALHRTTSGSPAGYDIWEEWVGSLDGIDVSEERLGEEWYQFGVEVSEATDFDPSVDLVPGREPTEANDTEDEPPDSEFQSEDAATDVLSRDPSPTSTGVLAESATQLLRMVPTGPYDIRIFNREYRSVDEYAVLAMIKRGLFMGADVRFGEGWIPAWEHPAFERISARLQGEATKILSRENATAEVTRKD